MIPKHLPSPHIKKKSCASKAIKIFSFLKKNAVSLNFVYQFLYLLWRKWFSYSKYILCKQALKYNENHSVVQIRQLDLLYVQNF